MANADRPGAGLARDIVLQKESRLISGAKARLARFGPFELDLETGELRKQGARVRLQAKPLQILQALLKSPGTVVSREELRQRLWTEDTFVDFESGLNTAANRLRLALGDSAEKPLYIETLPRVGYRFIAPLEKVGWEPGPSSAKRRPELHWKAITGGVVLIAVVAILFFALALPKRAEIRFLQITFRRGQVWSARFAPDGRAILYTAQWERGPRQMFLTNGVSPESRALGFEGLTLASVSRSGELALLKPGGTMNINGSPLSRVPMNGGAPLEIDRDVMGAEWSADGMQLAIVRAIRGTNQLEFPAGKVLYRTSGWLSHIRLSPDGRYLAFFEHPIRHDDAGKLMVLERNGTARATSEGWASAGGLAWHTLTKEIWFTASRDGLTRSLWAATPSGKVRPVAQAPGILTLRDISPDGRVLVSRDTRRLEMAGRVGGERAERDLSWMDWSRVQEISADGNLILFDESGEGAAGRQLIYVQHVQEGSTVRLGEGRALALSPDGKHALVAGTTDQKRFRLIPVGGGPAQEIAPSGLDAQWARFFPDGRSLLVLGNKTHEGLRLWAQDVKTAELRPITPEMAVRNVAVSPDSSQVAVLAGNGKLWLFPVRGGEPRIVAAAEPLAPIHWSSDGERLFVQHLRAYSELPARVSQIHLASGRLELWKELAPADQLGVTSVTGVAISAGGASYVYSYRRVLSELYLVDGWR